MDSPEEEGLYRLLSEQRRELAAAEAMDTDLEFAYRLQLEEALDASLACFPSSSNHPSPPPPPPPEPLNPKHDDDDFVLTATSLQAEELAKMEQVLINRREMEAEVRRMRLDLSRRIHDQKVAEEIIRIPEDDWLKWGDNFEKPFGEGSSLSNSRGNSGKILDGGGEGAVFTVYFKGLVDEGDKAMKKNGETIALAGIGVAICDPGDNCILELRKPLVGCGTRKVVAELKALIEAFNAAIALDLKRVTYCCDYYPLFQYVSGKWPAKQRKVAVLVNQVNLLQRKFTYCSPRFMARHAVKFAFKLAKDAIASQLTKPVESSSGKNLNETCVICLEDSDISHIFSIDGCQHRYCFSCMKQHVEVKLLHGIVPKCPHEECNSELLIDSCKKFLTNKSIETMQLRKLEASIPVTEKVYCPYPRCSALMSKTEVLEYSKNLIGDSQQSGPKKCVKCHGLFCLSCKVPWHSGMTCYTYKRLNPNPPVEDTKLKFLATRSLWRQCVKCNHMIELAEGCYHMTCRCGYEFCYNCGAEWKNKKATCSCPLWAEDNIWLEDHEEEEEDDEDDKNDDYYDSDSDYY